MDALVAIDPRPLNQMTRFILDNIDQFTEYVRVGECPGCGKKHNTDVTAERIRTNLVRVLAATDEAWNANAKEEDDDSPGDGFRSLDEFIPDDDNR
jgi:hypothetical protein